MLDKKEFKLSKAVLYLTLVTLIIGFVQTLLQLIAMSEKDAPISAVVVGALLVALAFVFCMCVVRKIRPLLQD